MTRRRRPARRRTYRGHYPHQTYSRRRRAVLGPPRRRGTVRPWGTVLVIVVLGMIAVHEGLLTIHH